MPGLTDQILHLDPQPIESRTGFMVSQDDRPGTMRAIAIVFGTVPAQFTCAEELADDARAHRPDPACGDKASCELTWLHCEQG